MNKADLINAIAEEAGLSRKVAKNALEASIKTISNTLIAGNKVSLVGFGSFSVSERSSRLGINPKTKESITIEAKKVVKFKAGTDLTDAIKQ